MTTIDGTDLHTEGHRERLRQQFNNEPNLMTETEKLELLLTYAIPRKDVSQIAKSLIGEYGFIQNVFQANREELVEKLKISSSIVFFFSLLEELLMVKSKTDQARLFDLPPVTNITVSKPPREKHVFADDETGNSIKFLPEAGKFSDINDFRNYLHKNLPYNSEETRKRRASYIIHRFFPGNELEGPLNFFLSKNVSKDAVKTVIFFSIINAEPIVQQIAEQLIYPNLPLGFIRRNQIKEFIENQHPDLKKDSINKAINAISSLYQNSGMAISDGDRMNFFLHKGDIEGFLYVFTSIYSEPGMFSFDHLLNGPVHRWMLWDKEWIRNQLYNLRDLGIISKISEIDTMNQFTVGMKQDEALTRFFEAQNSHPLHAVREKKGNN